MKNSFFVTTPIYYSNAVPHIGHAYASFLADTIARYERFSGHPVKFSTGVDENSQKIIESATAQDMGIMDYADMMASKHRAIWDGIDITYTDFIRTTEPRHHAFVQEMLGRSYKNDDIYEGVYEGKYCIGCESFKKDSDLIQMKDGKKVASGGELRCPEHPNKPITELKEKNYFFRLSKYEDRLLEFYKEHPDFIFPANRYNEVKEFVKGGLEDFSVSRETNRFGIPLPFDPSQVTYVWYDALFNYLTVCQGEEEKWWPNEKNSAEVLHIVGKDIIRFHAIYWPAMLWSAGYETPTHILTTGYFTIDGQKMSKTIGNVIDPVEYIQQYSRDALLLYLFQAFPIGEDGDFDREQALLIYNAKLANSLGNLLHRFTTLVGKDGGNVSGVQSEIDVAPLVEAYQREMQKYDLRSALQIVFAFVDSLNLYLAEKEPWKIKGDDEESRAKRAQILFSVGIGLRMVGLLLFPFFTEKMSLLLDRIGTPLDPEKTLDGYIAESISVFHVKEVGEPLYTRFDIE